MISGDKVTVSPDQATISFVPAASRRSVQLTVSRIQGHRYAVPIDLLPAVAAGRLDRRLFDLTGLIATGQHDARYADPDRAAAAFGPEHPRIPAAGRSTYTLTIEYLDLTGRRTENAAAAVLDLQGDAFQEIPATNGQVQVELPAGQYLLAGHLTTGTATDQVTHAFNQPTLDLTQDRKVVLDARQTRAIDVRPQNRSVRPIHSQLTAARRIASGQWAEATMIGTDPSQTRTAHLGAPAPADQMLSWAASLWAVPGPAGDFRNSPVVYGLSDVKRGTMFSGLRRVVPDGQLARVVSCYYRQTPGSQLETGFGPLLPELASGYGVTTTFDGSPTTTAYLEGGTNWWPTSLERSADGDVSFLRPQESSRYEAGRSYRENWRKAVIGPALSESAHRTGDQLRLYLPLENDAAGNELSTMLTSASSRLYRDGALIAESDQPGWFPSLPEVAPDTGSFRVDLSLDRSRFSPLSKRIDASWTFRSGTTAEKQALPLWVIRYQPDVDRLNRAAAGPAISVPFTLTSMAGAAVGTPGTPTVEVSGDDGVSWHPAVVTRTDSSDFRATLATPPGAKSLSLRSAMTDSDGNSVRQTIIGAFDLR